VAALFIDQALDGRPVGRVDHVGCLEVEDQRLLLKRDGVLDRLFGRGRLARERQRLGVAAVASVQADQRALRHEQLRAQLDRLLQAALGAVVVFQPDVGVGQAQRGGRRLGLQRRQLVEAGNGLLEITAGELRAAQGVHEIAVGGQGGRGILRRRHRRLGIATGQVVVDELQPRCRFCGRGLNGSF